MFSKRGFVFFVLGLGALLSMAYWWCLSRPVDIVDANSDRLSCVSYAPFHKPGQTPFDKTLYISTAQIETDMNALAQRFDCVRIYSVIQGLHEVPRLADKLGMKVLLGVWIGHNEAENDKELNLAIELARKYPAAIRAVIVGNEVLLRKEQPVAAMRGYIERVKAALPGVAVTSAEPWEFWLRYQKDLLDSVSFATVHIIPFWENDPVGIDDAVGHVSQIYRQVKAQLRGKEVMIGETGWPSYGRQRQEAEPSQVNQARFIREFALRAELEKIPYNVIEAFEQPWKRNYEGVVGGTWGLYTADGASKFPFRGPVAEAPAWRNVAYASMLLCFGVLLIFQGKRQKLDGKAILALLAISIAGGGAAAGACRELMMASRTALEWAYNGTFVGFGIAVTLLLGGPLAAWCSSGHPPPALIPASHCLAWFRRDPQRPSGLACLLGLLRFAFLFAAALACLMLVFDAGARDFPLAIYAAPAVGFALLALINGKHEADVEEMLLAGWIGFAGVWIAVAEHLTLIPGEPWRLADGINPHALGWSALCLLLSAAVLGPLFVELRTGQRQHA